MNAKNTKILKHNVWQLAPVYPIIFGCSSKKCSPPILLKLRILMYFDPLITNIMMKQPANFIIVLNPPSLCQLQGRFSPRLSVVGQKCIWPNMCIKTRSTTFVEHIFRNFVYILRYMRSTMISIGFLWVSPW